MAKVISGTQQFRQMKQYAVRKSTSGIRKIRCRKCQELAVGTPDGKGGLHYKCTGCGTIYDSRAL